MTRGRAQLRVLVLILGICVMPLGARAEVIMDGSLGGPAGAVTGPDYALQPSDGVSGGDNTYYSFSKLDVLTGETITFGAHATSTRVIVRVVGGAEAFFHGQVSVDRADVDLIIAGPAGLHMRETSSLGTMASATLTTANLIELDTASVFDTSATDNASPAGAPVAYLTTGETRLLSVEGADLTLAGSLSLFGWEVRVGGAAQLDVTGGDFEAVALVDGGRVDVAGLLPVLTGSGGLTDLRAGVRVDVREGSIGLAGRQIQLTEATLSHSGTSADDLLQLAGNVIGIDQGMIESSVGEGERAVSVTLDGADLTIAAATLQTVGGVDGGGVRVTGSSSLDITDTAFTTTVDGATGENGDVRLDSPSMTLQGVDVRATDATGEGADVAVTSDILILRGDNDFAVTGSLETTAGIGFLATARIDVVRDGDKNTTSVSSTRTGTSGAHLRIDVPVLNVFDGVLDLASEGETGPGDVLIDVDSLRLERGTLRTSNLEAGAASASLKVQTRQTRAEDSSVLETIAEDGDSGSLEVVGERIEFFSTQVRTFSEAGDAGGLSLSGGDVTLDGSDVRIESAAGDAGSMFVNMDGDVTVQTSSQVSVSAVAGSRGGLTMLAGNVIGIVDSTVDVGIGPSVEAEGSLLMAAPHIGLSGATVSTHAESGEGIQLLMNGDRLELARGANLDSCSSNSDWSANMVLTFTEGIAFGADDIANNLVSACNTGTGDGGFVSFAAPMLLYDPMPTVDLSAVSGVDGGLQTQPGTVIVDVSRAPSAECAAGAVDLTVGVDDGNAVLELAEIERTLTFCEAEDDTYGSLVRVSDEAAGANCAAGGVRVDTGLDDGGGEESDDQAGDGLLGDSEVDDTEYSCVEDDSGGEGAAEGGLDAGGEPESDAGTDPDPDAGADSDPDAGGDSVTGSDDPGDGESPDAGADSSDGSDVDALDAGSEDVEDVGMDPDSEDAGQSDAGGGRTGDASGCGCGFAGGPSGPFGPAAMVVVLALSWVRRRAGPLVSDILSRRSNPPTPAPERD